MLTWYLVTSHDLATSQEIHEKEFEFCPWLESSAVHLIDTQPASYDIKTFLRGLEIQGGGWNLEIIVV